MRMARDDHVDAGRGRVEAELREIVKHVEPPAAQLDAFRLRITGCPLIPVDVPLTAVTGAILRSSEITSARPMSPA